MVWIRYTVRLLSLISLEIVGCWGGISEQSGTLPVTYQFIARWTLHVNCRFITHNGFYYLIKCLIISTIREVPSNNRGTRWRIWLRHCATSRKVVGSIPDSDSFPSGKTAGV
jgi:hypothetical protein